MNRPWTISISFHSILVGIFIFFTLFQSQIIKEKEITFEVVEKFKVVKELPKTLPPPVEIKKKPPPKIKAKKKSRKVYGLSRKSIKANIGSTKGVAVKQGNTLAKTPDKLKLNKDDADSLPIPADEFLITSMPKVLNEIRPVYPEEMKKKGIEGNVVMNILIDQKGNVRDVKVVKSMGPEFDQAAINAMKRFEFRPA
ncbi:energy transducer TonB, partial [Bacteriovoracaceae bacterium]|nr:energy transducer TonB [Bacteriovoracaceae bacterium]